MFQKSCKDTVFVLIMSKKNQEKCLIFSFFIILIRKMWFLEVNGCTFALENITKRDEKKYICGSYVAFVDFGCM